MKKKVYIDITLSTLETFDIPNIKEFLVISKLYMFRGNGKKGRCTMNHKTLQNNEMENIWQTQGLRGSYDLVV